MTAGGSRLASSSAAPAPALALRPRRVAVLWNDPDGRGLANVTWTAWLLRRRAVLPVLPDRVLAPVGCREAAQRWWSRVIAHRVQRASSWWDACRVRVEGPELEPPIWHSHYLTGGASVRAVREVAAPLAGRVLDIGAGTGYAARMLDPDTTAYLPTDLPSGRDSADATISRDGVRPRVYCSGEALPFRDGTLDGVISVSVLEHVPDVPAILREAFRALRPGGQIVISVPFYFPFHGEPDDFRRWTVYGITQELRACGFEPEVTRRVGTSIGSLVLNLHLAVKYEWRTAPSRLLRLVSRAWPLALPWQAATNLLAEAVARVEPESRIPLGVVIRARRPRA